MQAPIHVLCVDHSDPDRARVRTALETAATGFVVEEAASLRELLRKVKAHRYDVVLSEWTLPGLKGEPVLDILRKEGVKTPVLVIERGPWETQAPAARRAGAADCVALSRPGLKKLPATIRSVLDAAGDGALVSPEPPAVLPQGQYRMLFEESERGIALHDADGCIVESNQAFQEMLGYASHELAKMTLGALVHPQCAERFQMYQREGGSVTPTAKIELRLIRSDGKIIWCSLGLRPVPEGRVAAGGPVQFSMVEDITQRRRTEAALRESQERWRKLVHSHPEPILISMEGHIVFINPSGARLLGAQTVEEILDRSLLAFCRPELHDVIRERRRLVMSGTVAPPMEHEIVRLDGSTRIVESFAVPIVHKGQRASQIVLRDVTQQRRLEREVLAAVDREQRRIGYDLHDGLGQQLTATAILAKILRRKLEDVATPDILRSIDEVETNMNKAISATQHIVRGLCPVELERYGLAEALQGLASSVSTAQNVGDQLIDCTFEDRSRLPLDDQVVATHLYRIAQEAVANAVKHSRAEHIQIRLTRTAHHTELIVEDDGIGFDPTTAPRGLGLETMKYRARLLGARFSIYPAAGTGTEVRCHLAQS